MVNEYDSGVNAVHGYFIEEDDSTKCLNSVGCSCKLRHKTSNGLLGWLIEQIAWLARMSMRVSTAQACNLLSVDNFST